VLGPEEVQRFRREIEVERGERAPGGAAGDVEDVPGFFDQLEGGGEGGRRRRSVQLLQRCRGGGWLALDNTDTDARLLARACLPARPPAGFFDELEEEEGEYVEHTSADVFALPGPFDDLFKGDANGDLVQERQPRRQQQGGRGKRQLRQR
jgi:hypothetical protein